MYNNIKNKIVNCIITCLVIFCIISLCCVINMSSFLESCSNMAVIYFNEIKPYKI